MPISHPLSESETALGLQIEMFGGLRVLYPGGVHLEFSSSQPATLLAILALGEGRSFTREELTETLWPESGEEDGRYKLRKCLHKLRQQLAQPPFEQVEIVKATAGTIRLHREIVQTDVALFEAKLAAAQRTAASEERIALLRGALELYRGDLLPGFYHESLLTAQERLAEKRRGALRDLVRAYEQTGELQQAVACARQALTLDPLAEELYSDLMRLYAALGQPAEVRRQYQEWERILRSELNTLPPESARRQMETLAAQAQEAAIAVPVPSVPPQNAVRQETPEDIADPPEVTTSLDLPPTETAPEVDTSAMDNNKAELKALRSKIDSERSRSRSAGRQKVLAAAGLAALVLTGWYVWRVSHRPTSLPTRPPVVTVQQFALDPGRLLLETYYRPLADEQDSDPVAVTTDDWNNIYVSGFVQTKKHDVDFLTLKYSPEGKLFWHQPFNGLGNDCDRPYAMTLDGRGHLYVAGESYNGDREKGGSQWGMTLVQYDIQSGRRNWFKHCKYEGGSDAHAIKVGTDSRGGVYLAGWSRKANKDTAHILLRYDAEGNLQWKKPLSASFGKPVEMLLRDMVVDKDGTATLTGPVSPTGTGNTHDIRIVQFDHNGNLLWEKRCMGDSSGDADPDHLALGPDGTVCLAGYLPVGRSADGSVQRTFALHVYDRLGKDLWEQRLPVGGPVSLQADVQGNWVVAGRTLDNREHLVVKYTPDGKLLWQKNLTVPPAYSQSISEPALALDSGGQIFLSARISGSAEPSCYLTRKLGSEGQLLWERNWQGTVLSQNVMVLTWDKAGNLLALGRSSNTHTSGLLLLKYTP